MRNNGKPGFRTMRGYQMLNQQKGQLTPAMEDYLEMIYRLCQQDNHARIGKLAQLLHVRPSSASKMAAKLAELGYLEYDRYEVILLTEEGRRMGAYLFTRHNTAEEFLNLLGSPKPLEEAELIEHALSPITVAHLDILLAFFRENPQLKKRFEDFRAAQKLAEENPQK